jgi:hypothetical protein
MLLIALLVRAQRSLIDTWWMIDPHLHPLVRRNRTGDQKKSPLMFRKCSQTSLGEHQYLLPLHLRGTRSEKAAGTIAAFGTSHYTAQLPAFVVASKNNGGESAIIHRNYLPRSSPHSTTLIPIEGETPAYLDI